VEHDIGDEYTENDDDDDDDDDDNDEEDDNNEHVNQSQQQKSNHIIGQHKIQGNLSYLVRIFNSLIKYEISSHIDRRALIID
jgi:hypothetical protein